MVAGGTYDNTFFFENVLNKFGGLFTGRVITNDFTLDNKQVTTITIAGLTNNDKLTSQGYVDSKAQEVKDYVDNHFFTKPEINVKIDGLNGLIDNLADDVVAVTDSVSALSASVGSLISEAILAAALATKADKSDVYDKGDIDDMLEEKANVDDVYTKTQVNNLLYGKANSADVYNKSLLYTKTEVNGFLLLKANISDVYTKNEMDTALNLKANAADLALKANTSDVYTKTQVYTKTEVDAALDLKADKSTTYTKAEVNQMFDGVVPVGDHVGQKYAGSTGGEIFNLYTTGNTRNIANGSYSHSEGYATTASGNYSHAEGHSTTAGSYYAHSEGWNTAAFGLCTHAGGEGTNADQPHMTAIGKYNEFNPSDLTVNAGKLFAIGNGSDENNRHDAFSVYNDGHITFSNNYQLYFGSIVFGWSNTASFTNIHEVIMIGMTYKYTQGGHKYLCVNVSGVPTWLTGSSTTDPLYLVYVRLASDTELYGNTFPLTGTNSGPGLYYVTNTTPLLYSLESDTTHAYSSKIVAHWNYNSYGTGFGATAKFNFTNALFAYYSDLS